MNIETFGNVTTYEDLEVGAAFICSAVNQKCIGIKSTDGTRTSHAILIPLEESKKENGVELPTLANFNSYCRDPIIHLPNAKIKPTTIACEDDQPNYAYARTTGHIYQTNSDLIMGIFDGRDTILVSIRSGELSKLEDASLAFEGWEIFLGDEDEPFFTWPRAID